MRYPVDSVTITQRFGANVAFYGPGGHTGIDLAAQVGDPVRAAVTGKVIAIGLDPNYVGGKYVIVRADDGPQLECYTGHMSAIDVTIGARVREGDLLGEAGMTGTATGPHVHFQVRHRGGGALIDPMTLLGPPSNNQKQETDDMKIKNRDQAKALYLSVLHRAASDEEADGLIGLEYPVAVDKFRDSAEWLTQNDAVLVSYPAALSTVQKYKDANDAQAAQITDLTARVDALNKSVVQQNTSMNTPAAPAVVAVTTPELKPGHKTSEFWVGIIAIAVNVILPQIPSISAEYATAGGGFAGLIAVAYMLGRIYLKSTAKT